MTSSPNTQSEFLVALESEFQAYGDALVSAGQKAYMKNRFEFFGIQAPVRKEIQKKFFNSKTLPPAETMTPITRALWRKPQREFQYAAQELVYHYTKRFAREDLSLFEFMITHKSWWDTVDFIAAKLVGTYFRQFPDQQDPYIQRWLASGNLWLQRTAILFQLNYKEWTDQNTLTFVITSMLGSQEFFINKAIGWMLRQYSKTNPGWVLDFCEAHTLNPLSRKEALRLIRK